MYPKLFDVPAYLLAGLGGVLLVVAFAGEAKRSLVVILAVLGAVAGGVFGYCQWGATGVPLRSYGTMILIGFLCGVWMAARRAPRLGIDPRHCMDVGVWGVVVGLLGARALHVLMFWPQYTPFHDGFDLSRIGRWFKFWEAGLAFHGVLLTVLPFTWLYCRRHKVPGVPFLDLAIPSLIAGQAFGRIGCFLFGCCYGKPSGLPWAVHFPPHAPAWDAQVAAGLIPPDAACSAGVHPTELYAAIGGGLVAAVLYSFWPRRRYDGQVLALTLIMAGVTRFFEELLRADEPAAFAAVPSLTTSHWLALLVVVIGVGLLFFFKQRGMLYTPPSGSGEPAHVPQ